jgi:hypothetical protein
MNTIPSRSDGAYTAPWRRVPGTIPASTTRVTLRQLDARYADLSDPLVASLPPLYREAVCDRLRRLLAGSHEIEDS